MKTYCECKKPDYICVGLWREPETFKGDYLWVHHSCGLPFPLVWEAHLRLCSDCMKVACLPWENLCQPCFKNEHGTSKNYHGLIRASKRILKELT